ncbi:unnamed protein product [Dovyalis caffra]|uniref:DUF7705 domain-containing protein n=1 Tax=Dovyalis caffra TaxID=77055 RepID=A0AAV1SJ67_9ROSI|nr:unnamed protein product [Dovyalis caffra]
MEKVWFCILAFSFLEFDAITRTEYMSAIGDPGMRRDSLRVAIEAWNQCNEVSEEVSGVGIKIIHMVDERDKKLGISNGSYGGN